jgi:hypothetical protein
LVVLEVEEEVSLVTNILVAQVLLVILDLALLIRVVVAVEEHITVLVVLVVLVSFSSLILHKYSKNIQWA